jgi:hypothetical protein
MASSTSSLRENLRVGQPSRSLPHRRDRCRPRLGLPDLRADEVLYALQARPGDLTITNNSSMRYTSSSLHIIPVVIRTSTIGPSGLLKLRTIVAEEEIRWSS